MPASIPAARDGADEPTAGFELLFGACGDYDCACEDMQMVLLELFVADPTSCGRGGPAGHVREEF